MHGGLPRISVTRGLIGAGGMKGPHFAMMVQSLVATLAYVGARSGQLLDVQGLFDIRPALDGPALKQLGSVRGQIVLEHRIPKVNSCT
jgi:hypothetical protein